MKTGTHPKYYQNTKVSCACGNSFTTGSTREFIKIEICNKCHPFYTGQQKFVDTVGRIERFQKKQADAIAKPFKKKEKKETSKSPQFRTLREMLMQQEEN